MNDFFRMTTLSNKLFWNSQWLRESRPCRNISSLRHLEVPQRMLYNNKVDYDFNLLNMFKQIILEPKNLPFQHFVGLLNSHVALLPHVAEPAFVSMYSL